MEEEEGGGDAGDVVVPYKTDEVCTLRHLIVRNHTRKGIDQSNAGSIGLQLASTHSNEQKKDHAIWERVVRLTGRPTRDRRMRERWTRELTQARERRGRSAFSGSAGVRVYLGGMAL